MSISEILFHGMKGIKETLKRMGLSRAVRKGPNPVSRSSSRRVRSLKLTSMNNWQRHLAEDGTYGASLFPVHSIVDSMYGDRAGHFVDASEQRAIQSAQYGAEAIRSLFSPEPDRSTD